MSNPFHAFRDRSVVQRIAMTGVFLGLVVLMQYLERFMPFAGTFVKLNFSLLFILPIFYFAGPFFGLTVVAIQFGIGYAFSTEPTVQRAVSQMILTISTIVAIGYMYIFSWVFIKVKKHNAKMIYISVSTVLAIAITLTVLNAVWFTPMYMWAYGKDTAYKIVDGVFDVAGAKKAYEVTFKTYYQIKHFGIPNYWAAIFAVYMAANITKFGLIYFVYFPMSKVLNHYLKR